MAKRKRTKPLIISIGTRRGHDKIQHSFMIKKRQRKKLGLEMNFVSINGCLQNFTTRIMCNSKRRQAFHLRLETKQGHLFSPLVFNIVLKDIHRVIEKGKINKKYTE